MEKIVISSAEVAETQAPAEQPARLEPKLAPAVPQWARWVLAPLVLFLPLLCFVAIVLRVAMRGLPPRTRYEWTSLLATLLIVSGIVTSAKVPSANVGTAAQASPERSRRDCPSGPAVSGRSAAAPKSAPTATAKVTRRKPSASVKASQAPLNGKEVVRAQRR